MDANHRSVGQGNVEYVLLLVLVVLAALLGLTVMGVDVQSIYCQSLGALGFANACGSYFADSFSDLSAWQIAAGTWKSVNGLLTGGPSEGRIFHSLTQSDYAVNLNAAMLKQGSGFGVFFRATNPSAVNGYDFQYDPGLNAFVFRKWVNGNELSPFATAPAPNYNWYNTNRNIQVVAKGHTFTASIDGKVVLQGTDSTYSSGGVGLRTWDSTQMTADGLSVNPTP